MSKMNSKLKLSPHRPNANMWYYEECRGLDVYCDTRRPSASAGLVSLRVILSYLNRLGYKVSKPSKDRASIKGQR